MCVFKMIVAVAMGVFAMVIGVDVALAQLIQKETESLVVTAQKRVENPQDVPISMTLFDEVAIDDLQLEAIQDIGDYTPSLMLFGIGFSTSYPPSIRGLFADALTLESTMGIYVDGVPVTMAVGANDPLLDIERVEVLKGPQGTLYGKNTEAGVLNIISRPPDNDPMARFTLRTGSDHLLEGAASFSGPVIQDTLYIGLSARHYQKEGYVIHTQTGDPVDDRENNFGKLTLRYTPSPDWDITLVKSLLKHQDGAASMGSSSMAPRQVSSDLEGKNHAENDATSLKVHHDVNDKIFLESVTTHRNFTEEKDQDYDFTPMVIYHGLSDNEYTKTSQEIRLCGTFGKLDWLVGLYGDTFEDELDEIYQGAASMAIRQTIDGNSLGAFTHLDYELTQKWHLIAGLRYDDEEKNLKDEIMGLDLTNSYSEFSPKLSVNHHFSSDIMGYLTVAKGYRAGGVNPYAMAGYPKTYDDESLISYDVGVKSILMDDRLTLNAALYYMDISDMQVTSNITGGTGNFGETYTSNAAEATSKGLELDFRGKLWEGITLFGGLGVNETTFDTFKDPLGDFSGNLTIGTQLVPKKGG